jgi:hypothetical protein
MTRAMKCPICKKPVRSGTKYYPFCGARCKTIDLGAWASEGYVISRPLNELDEEFDSPGTDADE